MPAIEVRRNRVRSSYRHGFARGPGESAHPEDWGIAHYSTVLGNTGTALLRGQGGRKLHAAFPGGTGNPSWGIDSMGNHLSFDGDDYLDAGSNDILNANTGMTITALVVPTGTGSANDVIAAKDSWTAGQGWVLFLRPDIGVWNFWRAGVVGITHTEVRDGLRTHVAATWDGVTARLFLQGVEVNSATTNWDTITDSTVAMYLGSRHVNDGTGNLDYWEGKIYEVGFHGRALAPALIREQALAPRRMWRPRRRRFGVPEQAAAAAGIRNPMAGPVTLRTPMGAF